MGKGNGNKWKASEPSLHRTDNYSVVFSNLLFNVSFASFQIATLRKQIVEFQQLQLPSSSGTQQPGPSAKPSSGESKPSGVSSDRDFADEDRIQKARNEIVLS